VAWRTPFSSNHATIAIDVEGFTLSAPRHTDVQLNEVSEGYFATIGTPILAGRDFDSGDVSTRPRVAIVNEELARRFFGGAQPLGRHLRVRDGSGVGPPVEIVGVVADTKEFDLREANQPIVYFAFNQNPEPGTAFTFALRSRGNPLALAPGVKATIADLIPRASMSVRTLERMVDDSTRLPRTLGLLAGFFGALALLLASMGLYGILSYTIARRRKEIGVRIALGAARSRVVGMVLGDVGLMVVAGITAGLLLSLAVTRLARTFLYRVARCPVGSCNGAAGRVSAITASTTAARAA
jgi:ABC-type antimicrobial peptide transport system permease subunit